jgi:DNA-binding XRE family transcriptional regulator
MRQNLKEHRERLGLALANVAQEIDVNRSTLYRIEAGEVAPTRRVARALFDYYRGAVPIGDIYDPEYANKPPG